MFLWGLGAQGWGYKLSCEGWHRVGVISLPLKVFGCEGSGKQVLRQLEDQRFQHWTREAPSFLVGGCNAFRDAIFPAQVQEGERCVVCSHGPTKTCMEKKWAHKTSKKLPGCGWRTMGKANPRRTLMSAPVVSRHPGTKEQERPQSYQVKESPSCWCLFVSACFVIWWAFPRISGRHFPIHSFILSKMGRQSASLL